MLVVCMAAEMFKRNAWLIFLITGLQISLCNYATLLQYYTRTVSAQAGKVQVVLLVSTAFNEAIMKHACSVVLVSSVHVLLALLGL